MGARAGETPHAGIGDFVAAYRFTNREFERERWSDLRSISLAPKLVNLDPGRAHSPANRGADRDTRHEDRLDHRQIDGFEIFSWIAV